MNIKVNLSPKEAESLLQPVIAKKYDDGFGIPPVVEVEIALPQTVPGLAVPGLVLPPSFSALERLRQYGTKNNGYRNKIGLIKEVRSMFGWGLKDAKDFVEAFYGL